MTTDFAKAVQFVREYRDATLEAGLLPAGPERNRAMARRSRALAKLAKLPGNQKAASLSGMGRLAKAAQRVVFGPTPRNRAK